MRAEAADGSGTNNANFSTPAADGGAPRMQMYLWPGTQFGSPNSVTIKGGATYGASWARFTPAPTPEGLPNRTLVYGGTGCSDSAYPVSRPGEEVDRRRRRRHDRLHLPAARAGRARRSTPSAVIVAHNATGSAPTLTGSMIDAPVVIPAVAVNAGRRRRRSRR